MRQVEKAFLRKQCCASNVYDLEFIQHSCVVACLFMLYSNNASLHLYIVTVIQEIEITENIQVNHKFQ